MTDEELDIIKNTMSNLELNYYENLDNTKKAKLNDIIYLGKIYEKSNEDGQLQEKQIYLLIEDIDGQITYKYYDQNSELLGIEKDNQYIPSKNNMYKNDTNTSIKNLNKDEGISLNDLEKEEKEKNEEISDEKDNKNNEIYEIPLNQNIQLSNLDSKENVSLNEMHNGNTLKNILGLDNEYESLLLVPSSNINKYLPADQKITNKDAFVARKSNGELKVLTEDVLEFDTNSGTNPNQRSETINTDGNVAEESVTSRYKIVNGNGNQYISVGYDESFGKEIKFSDWSPEKGGYLDTELKTNRIYNQDTNQEKNYDETMSKGIYDSTNKLNSIENIKDSDKNGTKEKDEIDYSKINDDKEIDDAVRKILENDAISECYSEKTVKEYLIKVYRSDVNISLDDAINCVESDLENTTRGYTKNKNH